MLKRTTSKKPDTNSKIVLNSHYSLREEKYSKEKAIAELDVQLDLATKLLLKATDVEQRYKLEAKKKSCLEKKDALLTIINEIKNTYIFFYKGQLIYEFVEEFYSFFIELFNTDSDIDPFLLKNLEILQNKEKKLIKLADCALSLKDVIGELSYYDYNNLETNIENFFNKIENEHKVSNSNCFLGHILFCKKIFEIFKELMKGLENRFDLNKLRDFFQIQFVSFSIPTANHLLVGIVAIFFYKTLFNFLNCQPIASSFKKLSVYIKFHIDISSFSMENNILHDLSSAQKKTTNLKYKFKDFLEIKSKLSKCAVDKYLKLMEVRQQELDSIKFILKIFFKNKDHIQSLKLLNTILKKEGEELICFMKSRTGFDFYFVTDKQTIYTMQSNKMFIKYFFSCIAKPSTAESLRNTVEHFIVLFEIAVDCASIDLMTLTNKELLALSYLSYFIHIFFELHIELERLENKLVHIKLDFLDISLNLSLDKLNTDIKNLEDKEKEFFEKKFMNKNKFSECKKNLLEDFEFFLGFIKDVILQADEMYTLQSKFSYAYGLNKLNLNGQSFPPGFFNLGDEHVNKTSYLIDMKNKFSIRQETIKKYLVPEICAPTRITKTKKTSLERQQVEVVKRLGFESLFVPMARIAKDLCIVAEYIQQPEMTIIEFNKNSRKKNKFPSAIGRIRASANLITQGLHESSHRLLGSKLVNSLEVIKQTIEKTITALDNDEALNFFRKNIESCFLFAERIHQEIIAVTSQCELHNCEIRKVLENDVLEEPVILSNFFRCDSVLKKINTILKKESYNLRQKIGCLKNVISVISNTETSVINKFYSVIYQAEEYEKIFHCIQQQNEALSVCAHSASDFPVADKNMQTVEPENRKSPSKNKKKRLQRKQLITRAENYFLEAGNCSLVELRKFSEWNTGLEDWKRKRYSHLDNVFNTIEKCSFANLNKTATAFFKILDYYTKELLDKHQELKDQLSKLSTFFQDSLDCVKPIKNFMLYSDQWFYNVLARLEVCRNYLLQSSKTYNAMIGNNSTANVGCMPYFPTSQVINSLLAEYLNYFIIYNKNNSRLLFEEKKLAAINEEFIVKILKKDSLRGIEQEADLLSQFNEKLREVNHLNSVVKEAQEKKQKAKEELAQIVDPETLNFYLRRIDPSDMQILTNSSPIRSTYAFAPSNAYFFTYDAANLNVNNIDYKFDMEYRAK